MYGGLAGGSAPDVAFVLESFVPIGFLVHDLFSLTSLKSLWFGHLSYFLSILSVFESFHRAGFR